MTDYKALREAAEKAKVSRSVPAWDAFTDKTGPDDVLSLLDALAASEAKPEKAREALERIDRRGGLGYDVHNLIATTLKNIA